MRYSFGEFSHLALAFSIHATWGPLLAEPSTLMILRLFVVVVEVVLLLLHPAGDQGIEGLDDADAGRQLGR